MADHPFMVNYMNRQKIGVIADDFTGASDAASFLAGNGYKTILLTEIPKQIDFDSDCIVVALKVRSVDSKLAIKKVNEVYSFFEKINVDKIYFKYCSTFDSTKEGNIGKITDWLLEKTNNQYTVLCPSLPVNGRIVKDGVLFVNGVPLAESPMKNHPLNPMWDSYIPTLMKEQSKYNCHILKRSDFNKLDDLLHNWKKEEHFYIVPDYTNDNDAELIAGMFSYLNFFTGGSGLLEYLLPNKKNEKINKRVNEPIKAIVLSGSCSEMTHKQVNNYINGGGKFISVNAKEILSKKSIMLSVFDEIKKNLPDVTLVYSDGFDRKNRSNDDQNNEAKAIEKFMSELSKLANDNGFNRIIVAGGETSGAVTLKLGYKEFYIGKTIAPGVPELIPVNNKKMTIILKSGNFGDECFFRKAIG